MNNNNNEMLLNFYLNSGIGTPNNPNQKKDRKNFKIKKKIVSKKKLLKICLETN